MPGSKRSPWSGWVLAALLAASPEGWCDGPTIDGEADDWPEQRLAHDVTGDSNGPSGSDILWVDVTDDAAAVSVVFAVAGAPNLNPSVVTYSVDFSIDADFYNHRLVAWGDGNELSGTILYVWESRTSGAEPRSATGAQAAAASVVEFRIPFALIGGRFEETVWMKVSTGDHVTGNVIDDLQFQYRLGGRHPAPGRTGAVPGDPTGAGSSRGTPRIALDGNSDDWLDAFLITEDDSADAVGPLGAELVGAALACDDRFLYVLLVPRDRPSVAAGVLEYFVETVGGQGGERICVAGDGTALTRSRMRSGAGAEEGSGSKQLPNVEAAAGEVVELKIPQELFGTGGDPERLFRLGTEDWKTGRTFDEIEVTFRLTWKSEKAPGSGAADDRDPVRAK